MRTLTPFVADLSRSEQWGPKVPHGWGALLFDPFVSREQSPERKDETMSSLNGKTYDELREQARIQSKGGYAAVIERVTYMQSDSFMTVATSSSGPIESRQRGNSFIGVMSQFKDGQPFGSKPAPVVPATIEEDSDVCPF
jgi:hypothetical protein